MHPYAALYHAAVLGLGLTTPGTLVYGVCSSPVYREPALLVNLISTMAGYILVWSCCLYAKRRRDTEAFTEALSCS